MFEITIPVTPRTKKNHGRIVMFGKYPKLLPSSQYVEFEKKILDFLKDKTFMPIEYPINLKCIFYKDKDFRADLCGYLQAIMDALVKAEFIKDDNHKIVVSTDGSRVKLDRKNPRIEITITEVKDE